MKYRTLLLSVAILTGATVAAAQFGGILNKAKNKIDAAKTKAAPVTDRAERAVDSFQEWIPEEEEAIGLATAAKMIAMFGLVDDPELTKYVNLVGHSVAQFSPRPLNYRFGILDSDIVGAYALPGGFVFVTRAAISGMTNEAQLAGLLGHEIIHVAERHLEEQVRTNKGSTWAVEEARARTSAGFIDWKRRADALLKDMFTMSLSQDKEESADVQGARMSFSAGYTAGGLLEFLKAMEAANENPAKKRMFGQMLSTHPPFPHRIAILEPVVDTTGGKGKTLEDRFQKAVHR